MAAAAASGDSSDDVVSCVYCLEVEPYLIDPRMLPCGHIFCSACLQKDAKTNQIIQCANCRWVYIRSLLCSLFPKGKIYSFLPCLDLPVCRTEELHSLVTMWIQKEHFYRNTI